MVSQDPGVVRRDNLCLEMSALGPLTALRNTSEKAPRFAAPGDFAPRFPIWIPLCCPRGVHDYVDSLSHLLFNHTCLDFRRDRITQVRPNSANLEKVRVHNPLGNTADLARHLILWLLAVPA